jgi:hypothetical protein
MNGAPSILPNVFETPSATRPFPRSTTMVTPALLPRYGSVAMDMDFDPGFGAVQNTDPAFAAMANPAVTPMGPPSFIPTARRLAPRTIDRTSELNPYSQDSVPSSVYIYNQQSSQVFPSSSQLPPSSSPAPSSASQSQQPDPKNSSSQTPLSANTNQAGATVMASLHDATALYGLSSEALEQAIGEIVREDGFIRLVSAFHHIASTR